MGWFWSWALIAAAGLGTSRDASARQTTSMFWCREYWNDKHDWSLCIEDFDEDGIDDLLSTGNNNQLLLRRGKSDGTFGQPSASPIGLWSPFNMTSGDFDGDGHVDAAVVPFSYSANLEIFPGNGDGTFQPPIDLPTGASVQDPPSWAEFADLDGDGIQDLVTSHWNTDVLRVFKGLGSFQFGPATTFPTAAGPVDFALTDFDRDGHLDVAILAFDSAQIQVRLGDGQGGFAAPTSIATGHPSWAMQVADLDGDGASDVVAVDIQLNQLVPIWGDGAGHFTIGAPLPVNSFYSRKVCVGDFDGDGVQDLVSSDTFNGTLSFLRGLGQRQFAAATTFNVGDNGIAHFERCDTNRDGVDDLAFVLNRAGWQCRIGILPGRAGVGLVAPTTIAVPNTPAAVATTDFDSDGHADCLVAQWDWSNWKNSSVSVALGDGHGHFVITDTDDVRGMAERIVAGDFDGDGNQDAVVVTSPGDYALLLRGDGAGKLFPSQIVLQLGDIADVCARDVDGDGRDDLIAVLPGLSSISVSLGQSGGLGVPTVFAAGTAGVDADLGDFDGDGHLDVAIAGADGTLVIAFGDGAGAFTAQAGVPVGVALVSLALGDFNRDGRLDVVVAGTDGAAFTLLNSSAGLLAPVPFDVLGSPYEMIAVDVNADGLLDLAAAQPLLQFAMTVSLGDGLGGFSAPLLFNGGGNRIASADFDEDFRTDLAMPGNGKEVLLQLQRDTWPPPTAYCTAGTSSFGCTAQLSAAGVPSTSASSGFVLAASHLDGQRNGELVHGISGPLATPWAATSTSFLCVQPPLQRTGLGNSGGTLFQCDGALTLDWTNFMRTHPSALGAPIQVGQTFWAQAWYRDPTAPRGSNLSNGVTFTLVP